MDDEVFDSIKQEDLWQNSLTTTARNIDPSSKLILQKKHQRWSTLSSCIEVEHITWENHIRLENVQIAEKDMGGFAQIGMLIRKSDPLFKDILAKQHQ